MRWRFLFLSTVLALSTLASGPPVRAQDIDAETREKLKAELKRELGEELREEIKKELMKETEAHKKALVAAVKEESTHESLHEEGGSWMSYERGQGLAINDQRLVMRGYGNVAFSSLNERNGRPKQKSESFSVGDFDLFFTGSLTDRLSLLGELFFEMDNGETGLDMERLQLQYTLRDWFNISAGRHHTPLGYWNSAFHHGKYFQTSVDRPLFLNFEDEGGILPVHSIGMEVWGRKDFSPFGLLYSFDISNGRGKNTDLIQNVKDTNHDKAFAFQVALEPNVLPGLRIGGNLYTDRLPPDRDDPTRIRSIRENIFGVHLIYLSGNYELLSELFRIQHRDKTSNKNFYTNALYVQLAYEMGDFKPFYRFEHVDFDGDDPFFTSFIDENNDLTRNSFGLRYELVPFTALKFQYSYLNGKKRDSSLFQISADFAF